MPGWSVASPKPQLLADSTLKPCEVIPPEQLALPPSGPATIVLRTFTGPPPFRRTLAVPATSVFVLPAIVLLSRVVVPAKARMPPATVVPLAVLPATVLFCTVVVPAASIPPPPEVAVLPAIVLSRTVSEPLVFEIPPPTTAALPMTALASSTSVPELSIPPPNTAPPPFVIVSPEIVTVLAVGTVKMR